MYGEDRLCTGMEERKSTGDSLEGRGQGMLEMKPGKQAEHRDSSESAGMLEQCGQTAVTRIPSLLNDLSFKIVRMAS